MVKSRPHSPAIYLVRHAHAGSRSAWDDDDRLRPLSKKGRRQAKAVAAALADVPVTRLISSPLVRCTETLVPLAEAAGLAVESDDRLAEGSDGPAALRLANELREAGEIAVLCSHGDVIPDLLSELKALGTTFHDPLTWPKGSTWVLASNGTTWSDARFVASGG